MRESLPTPASSIEKGHLWRRGAFACKMLTRDDAVMCFITWVMRSKFNLKRKCLAPVGRYDGLEPPAKRPGHLPVSLHQEQHSEV